MMFTQLCSVTSLVLLLHVQLYNCILFACIDCSDGLSWFDITLSKQSDVVIVIESSPLKLPMFAEVIVLIVMVIIEF